MLSSVEQAFVGREEIRAPLKTPAWEATSESTDRQCHPVTSSLPENQVDCLNIRIIMHNYEKF